MTSQQIREHVREAMMDAMQVTPDAITPTTTVDELGADSIDMVEFVMQLEERTRMDIPDAEADRIQLMWTMDQVEEWALGVIAHEP